MCTGVHANSKLCSRHSCCLIFLLCASQIQAEPNILYFRLVGWPKRVIISLSHMHHWDKKLFLAQFAHQQRLAQDCAAKIILLQGLNHNSSAATPLDIPSPHRKNTHNSAWCKFAERLQQLVARATKLTIAAQQRQKHYYDGKHTAMHFAVIGEVLLLTAGLNLRIAGTDKLAPRWVGPNRIVECIGNVAYKLDLPETKKYIMSFMYLRWNAIIGTAAFTHPRHLTSLVMNLSGRWSPSWTIGLSSVDAQTGLSTWSNLSGTALSKACGNMMWVIVSSSLSSTGLANQSPRTLWLCSTHPLLVHM